MSSKRRSQAVPHRSFRPAFQPNRITAALLVSMGGVSAAWGEANVIQVGGGSYAVPDVGVINYPGTGTQVKVSADGKITDITTTTVRGQTGFNSFRQFQVGDGNTVNLYVPGGATALVNLVHDSRVMINGTLNGVLADSGKIGGHIIFADPHGLVVGSQGVINVGSLTVSTPSAQQMQQLSAVAMSGTDGVGDRVAEDLAAGRYNDAGKVTDLSSPDRGKVEIKGRIEVAGSVNIFGAAALVADKALVASGVDPADAVFKGTVNVDGAAIGQAVKSEQGALRIVGRESAEVSGELLALMKDSSGGGVYVSAGDTLEVKGTARIATAPKVTDPRRANTQNGRIELTGSTVNVRSGAQISSVANSTGNGKSGDIRIAAISNGACAACEGSTGKLDSVDALIAEAKSQPSGVLNVGKGTATVLIENGAVVDASHANEGQAGNVQVSADAISKQIGGYSSAQAKVTVAGTLKGRDVSVQARATSSVDPSLLNAFFDRAEIKASIEKLKQRENWSDEQVWSNIVDSLLPLSGLGSLKDLDQLKGIGANPEDLSQLVGLLPYLAVSIAHADASVDILDKANLVALRDLLLNAESTRKSTGETFSIPVVNGFLPFNAGIAFGRISGTTALDVRSGARLSAVQHLDMQARSDNLLKVTAESTNNHDAEGKPLSTVGFAFAMANSDITTHAQVHKGALLNTAGDVSLIALTEQSLENKAQFKSIGNGAVGGPVLALSVLASRTEAKFDADLKGANRLNVSAVNLVTKQTNEASSQTGKSKLDFLKFRALGTVDPIKNYVLSKFKDVNPTQPTDSKYRLAATVAVATADHDATASIGSGANVDLRGDLTVTAVQELRELHNVSTATVNGSSAGKDQNDYSLSVALAIGVYNQDTRALIGDGAVLAADRVGVGARFEQPLSFGGFDRWSSLGSVFSNLKALAGWPNDIGGLFSTQYANSTGTSDKLAITGSVSVVTNTVQTQAWVGDNVSLTARRGSDAAWSSSLLDRLNRRRDSNGLLLPSEQLLVDRRWNWQRVAEVGAENHLQQLAVAGNIGMLLFGTSVGTDPKVTGTQDGTALGGSVNVQTILSEATAGIGAGTTVDAKGLNVSALQDDLVMAFSPSAGEGVSAAANGAAVANTLTSRVGASLHSSSTVNADKLDVHAEHRLGLWTAAGGVAMGGTAGFGGGLALNVLTTTVEALVGDNRSWRPTVMGTGLSLGKTGLWKVNQLDVQALSNGQSGAFAIAGAVAKGKDEQKDQDTSTSKNGDIGKPTAELADSFGQSILQSLTFGVTGLTDGLNVAGGAAGKVKDVGVTVGGKLKGAWGSFTGLFKGKPAPAPAPTPGGGGPDPDPAPTPDPAPGSGSDGGGSGGDQSGKGFAIAGAGSASLNISAQKSRALVSGISLDPRSLADGGSTVNLLALNQTHQYSGSGAGAITLAGKQKSESSAALSGALAFNNLLNVTEARLQNATLTNNDALRVQSLSGGDQIAMGLGLSVATAGTDTNVAVSLSGSAGYMGNKTVAQVIDSRVLQRAAAPGSIEVAAYDRARVMLGGGAFAGSKGNGGSVGGSVVVGVLNNTLAAEWLGSQAEDFARFDLSANSAARVLGGAMAAAVSTGSDSGTGAGSLVALVLNNSTTARVDGWDPTQDNNPVDLKLSSLKGGTLSVTAQSLTGASPLDALFSAAAAGTLSASDMDQDGNRTAAGIDVKHTSSNNLVEGGVADGTTSHDLFNGQIAGEAVMAVAGSLAASGGQAGVGGSLALVYAGSRYGASLASSLVDLSGALAVRAGHGSDVIAAAIGAAGSSAVGVSGSATALVGRGDVSASVDMGGRTLKAASLDVSAVRSGGLYSLAGNITGSKGTASVGGALSLADLEQHASATVGNGTYQLGGNLDVAARMESRIISAALSGVVSGSGVAVGGAMVFNRIADVVTAQLSKATVEAANLKLSTRQPASAANIWSLAFNLAAGGGAAGVGGAVAVNLIEAQRNAELLDSKVDLTGAATLESSFDGAIWGVGVDAAGGNTAGVGGSVVVNNIGGGDRVRVNNSTLRTQGSGKALTLDAASGSGLMIAALSGSVTGGGTGAVGGALSVNRIGINRAAQISGGSLVSGFSSASLAAGSSQAIYSAALAGGGGGTFSVNGSSTSNVIEGSEQATVSDSTLKVGSLSLSAARGDRTIWSLAGVGGGSGTASFGVANANNVVLAKRIAEISQSVVELAGSLELKAGGAARIRSAALGGGGAGTAAVAASVAANVIQGEERASLNGSTVTGANGVKVLASEGDADIVTLAGNVQGAGTGAGAGAIAVSTIDQQRRAQILGSYLGAGSSAVAVTARSGGSIYSGALSGAVGGTGGGSFSNTSNHIGMVTEALVDNSAGSAGTLGVKASDDSVIRSVAGGLAVGGTASAGLATAVNHVGNRIEARVRGNRNAEGWTVRDLLVNARSGAAIDTLSTSISGSGTASVGVGASTSLLLTASKALIDGGARVRADNNVVVQAANNDRVLSSGLILSGSGTAAVSGLATVTVVESTTEAGISGSGTQVDALAKGDAVAVDSGVLKNAPNTGSWASAQQFTPVLDLQTQTEQVRGLAVRATSLQQVGVLSNSTAVSLVPLYSGSVAALSNTNVLAGATRAWIEDVAINQGDNSAAGLAQQVSVGAFSHAFSFGGVFSASLSLGVAAVAATLDSGVISREVEARLSNVRLVSRGDTSVRAASTQAASNVVVSGGGGIVGVAGGAGVLVVKGSTQALVDRGSQLDVGALKVSASALNQLSANVGSVAGGAVGAGASQGFAYNQSTVRAWVGQREGNGPRTRVASSGAVSIRADSDTDVLGNSASASGGAAALAGAANIVVLENTTEAGARYADLGSDSRRLASLDIHAVDRLGALLNAGGLGLAGGGPSLGAAANVLAANSAVRALLIDSDTRTAGALSVTALRETNAKLFTLTAGVGGSAALGGSLGLLLLGPGAIAQDGYDPLAELDNGGKGTLSTADRLGNRDVPVSEYDSVSLVDGQVVLGRATTSAESTRAKNASQLGSVKDRLGAGASSRHETVARVTGGNVTAGAVKVTANDLLRSLNVAGSGQLGSIAAGGGMAFSLSNARVSAELSPVSLSATSLELGAHSGTLALQPGDTTSGTQALDVRSYAGAVGFGAGLGAALSIGVLNNQVEALLGGGQTYTGTLKASALEDSGVTSTAGGGAAGGLAAGVVVATAKRTGSAQLNLAGGAQLSASDMALQGQSLGSVTADAIGAAGGLVAAGTAALAVAQDSTRVQVASGNQVRLEARSGQVLLDAQATPRAKARAIGATLGGTLGVGASVAVAESANRVSATLGDRNEVIGQSLSLKARLLDASGSGYDPKTANVSAEAVAGTGALYYSANASVATATNSSVVTAATGSDLKLPAGAVDILADSRTQQYAKALGISAGGLALGAAVAEAKAVTLTEALLGARAMQGALTRLDVNASGRDLNQADSTAGSGGLVAGNASVAKTLANGVVRARIGSGSQLNVAGALTLKATYQGHYASQADSVNAALLGGSGALARNQITGTSAAEIGDGAVLFAKGNLLAEASNLFASHHAGAAASGAGGGVISGQAVVSDTDISGSARVEVGDNASLAGAQDGDWAKSLQLLASQQVLTRDYATLSTGGGIAAGGVETSHDVTLDSQVKVGAGSSLHSLGSLALNTYHRAGTSAEALASTWGAAGGAGTVANSTLTSTQGVSVGRNARLFALGNVTLGAGQDKDGRWTSSLVSDASAQSVVRGIIAIPVARASSLVKDTTRVTVASGSEVVAARDITIGGFKAQVSATADGTARGYQLGFIPVTDRDSTTKTERDSQVSLEGTFIAGRYNELLIEIDANGNLTQTAGLPIPVTFTPGFVPTAWLDAMTGMSPEVSQILRGTLSSSAVGAFGFGDMLAAGGNITVQADRVSGSASLTAKGAPRIEITNRSNNYLLIGSVLIPDQPSGRVLFTGGASEATFGGHVSRTASTQRAQVRISNTYSGGSGNSPYGPAIFLTDDIYNQGGLIHIANANGSLGQFGTTWGQQVLVEVPNGSMTVFSPDKYYSVGGNPLSEWKNFAAVTGSANVAIELIANAFYGSQLGDSNRGLLYQGAIYGDDSGSSIVLFGGCRPATGSVCSESVGKSFTGQAVQFHGITNQDSWMPVVRSMALQKKAYGYNNASLQGGSKIVGGQVGIQAKYIDINGTISSGQQTQRSLVIDADFDNWVSQQDCRIGDACLVDIPTQYLLSTGGAVAAKFDFGTNTIQLDDINASGGGFVYLKGGIISTNNLGAIKVNNGYGQVQVTNRSSSALQLGNIETGNSSVGIVQIVDTLKAPVAGNAYATTWYVHTQGQGLAIYDNANGGNSLASARLVSTSGASSASYNPLANARFEWTQKANLSRSISNNDPLSVSNWVWTDVAPNEHWTYSTGTVVQQANDATYQQDISGSFSNFDGRSVAYHGCGKNLGEGCNWGFIASGQHTDGDRKGELYAGWTYRYPLAASITVKHSVKADNPFSISFVGNSSGSIDVTTGGDLYTAGRLNNAAGTTTLRAGGDILSLKTSSLYSAHLDLQAGGAIGSDLSAFRAGLVDGGTLRATANGSINLDLSSSAVLRTLASQQGNLTLRASGSLLAGISDPGQVHLQARNLVLESGEAIGGAGQALRLKVTERTQADGSVVDGRVDASAVRDIYLDETQGDLWVGRIASSTGDVWVRVANGSLRDANRRLAAQTLSDAQRASVWERLKLTSALGAEDNIRVTTATPFEQQVNAQYREYWSLLQLGKRTAGELQLDARGIELYRPLAELRAGKTGLSDAEVVAQARSRLDLLEDAFSRDIGADWRDAAAFRTYNEAFAFHASQAQLDALGRDAVWTEGELRYAIDKVALGTSGGSSVGNAEPNLSGRRVTLQVASDVGQLANNLDIDFQDLRSGNLSAAQAAALVVANAPGDVQLVRDANGQVTRVSVNRTLPFYVAASEAFSADVGGHLFLQANGDLQLDAVKVGQDARLATPGSLLVAAGSSGLLRVGGDLSLLAGNGSLGNASDPSRALSLDVSGRLLAASSGQDVALRWLKGDFRIGRVLAVGDVYLEASDGSLSDALGGLAVSGRNIRLKARDSIGAQGGALQVQLESASGGSLSAEAGQGIWLSSEKDLSLNGLKAGGAMGVTVVGKLGAQNLSAAGDLSLGASDDLAVSDAAALGDLRLTSLRGISLGGALKSGGLLRASAGTDLHSLGGAQLDAGRLELTGNSLALGADNRVKAGSLSLTSNGLLSLGARSLLDIAGQSDMEGQQLRMDSGVRLLADGLIRLRSLGDMRLGQLVSRAASGQPQFDLRAGGHLLDNGDRLVNLSAQQPGQAQLHADGDIGEAGGALRVSLPQLDQAVAGGALYLDLDGDTRGDLLQAGTRLALHGNGLADYRRLQAGSALGVEVSHLVAEQVQAGGDWTLRATRAQIGTARSEGRADLVVSQRLDATRLGTAGRLDLRAGEAVIDRVDADGELNLAATGLLQVNTLGGGASGVLKAADLRLGEVTLQGVADMSAPALQLTRLNAQRWLLNGGSAQVGDVVVTRDADLQLTGDLRLASLNSGSDVQLHSRNANLGAVVAAGRANLLVDQRLDASRLDTAGRLDLRAGDALIDRANANGELNLAATGLLQVNSLGGGANAVLKAADLRLGEVTLQGVADMTAPALQLTRLNAQRWLLNGGSAQVGDVAVTRDADLQLSGDLRLSSLNSGSGVRMRVGSASRIGQLDVGGDLDLQLPGVLDLGRATVQGKALLAHSGVADTALRYGDLTVANSLTLTGAGDWTGGQAQVGEGIEVRVGSADLGLLDSARGALLLRADGLFHAGALTSRAQGIDLEAGRIDVGTARAADTLRLHSRSDLSLFSGLSGSDMRLTTAAGSLGTIRFGLLTDPSAANVLVPSHLKAGRDLLVQTDGDVFGGNAEAERELRMLGRNLFFGRAQSLQDDIFLQASGAASQGHGNISGLLVEAKRDVGIVANGDLNMPTVRYGGTYSLKAGRDLTIGLGGNLDISGYAEAGRDLTFIIAGNVDLQGVTAGRNVSIESGEYINIDEAVRAGGDVRLVARSGDIRVGQGVYSTAQPYQGQALSGNVVLQASGNVSAPVIEAAAGSIDVSGGHLTLGSLGASGDVSLLARGAISVNGTSRSGGNQTWQADGQIGFNQLLAQGQALLDSLMDVRGSLLRAGQGATVDAGRRAGGDAQADIQLTQVEAPRLALWAGDLVRVADAGIGQRLSLQGGDIQLYGRHTGAGQLDLWVEGSGQANARRLELELDAADVRSPRLNAVDSRIKVSGNRVELLAAAGVDRLALQTGSARILMDNLSPAYQGGADVQLYELDKAFRLKQDDLTSTTSAYVLHRRTTHQVLVENFSTAHAETPTGVLYQGISAARYLDQHLSGGGVAQRLASLLQAPAAPSTWTPNWQGAREENAVPMNLDLERWHQEGTQWQL
ncbi:leukotoxin LktA family filamentous adhesin [Pseudomonas otitidis]|uniref:Leukotoxin LktA family filamentous adhesin n=1 Tax=Metapseudomonas otitidis TaxID=319939 RepID=A0A7X3HE27_9GAMM|nr:leukotoxin LktA family filamentous adhesin [Pseudomonas otitidis]MWK59071.1 leukotoxin LktA family filamentous adhesin [Pseudomonas otitidis]